MGNLINKTIYFTGFYRKYKLVDKGPSLQKRVMTGLAGAALGGIAGYLGAGATVSRKGIENQVRRRHPEYSADELKREVNRRYGEALKDARSNGATIGALAGGAGGAMLAKGSQVKKKAGWGFHWKPTKEQSAALTRNLLPTGMVPLTNQSKRKESSEKPKGVIATAVEASRSAAKKNKNKSPKYRDITGASINASKERNNYRNRGVITINGKKEYHKTLAETKDPKVRKELERLYRRFNDPNDSGLDF